MSADGGSVWYEVPYQNMSKKYFYGWRIWSIDVPVEYEGLAGVLSVRTWDNALNTQPTYVRSAWYVYSLPYTNVEARTRLILTQELGLACDVFL